jgi:hypothetical protein
MPATSDSRVFDDLVAQHPKARKILAEGDSWFAYPRQFIIAGPSANIVDQLAKRKDLVIYSTASNGDEAVAMLSGEQKFALLKKLRHTHFDYLLLSGGGNDIVGRYDFDFLIRPRPNGGGWLDCIHQERLAIKLRQLESAYLSLCEVVGEFSQNKEIRIVTHTYDLAIPDKSGFELFDVIPLGKSWMYPYLVKKGIADPGEQRAIVAHIMGGFREMLLVVQARYPGLIKVVDTQGTLGESEWRNEIHPTSGGFRKIAEKIYSGGIV